MKKYITGDLLHYKICNAKYLIEVTNTSKHGYCFKGVKDNFNGVICDEFIEDIPLTPEILEKNGWKKDKDGYFNDSYHIRLCENNTNYAAYKVVNNSIVWLRTVENVPDLQHLLFGLDISLKIEV